MYAVVRTYREDSKMCAMTSTSIYRRVFQWLSGYKNDILFLEEDGVLSPDFVKVMWFMSEVKLCNAHIIQLDEYDQRTSGHVCRAHRAINAWDRVWY